MAAGKITAAAYPELTSNTHWLAPMEATEGMIDAAAKEEAWRPSRHWEPHDAYSAMRDAYLEQQSDIQAGLDALKEPKAGTWGEIKDKTT